jgi:hypothetical protein
MNYEMQLLERCTGKNRRETWKGKEKGKGKGN